MLMLLDFVERNRWDPLVSLLSVSVDLLVLVMVAWIRFGVSQFS